MVTERLRVGFVGIKPQNFGIRGFARKVGENAAAPVEGVELVSVADLNEEHRALSLERFGFRSAYADYREMIEKEELDVAVILLPTFLHKEVTIACLEAGLHVLCEKPPTSTYDEMLEVAEVARKSRGKYMFVRQSRFTPHVRAARKMIEEGKLGEIYCAEAKWIRSRGGQIRGDAWRSEKNRGGGVLLDLGIHGIDQAWFAMGRPRPVEVCAGTFTAFKRFASDPLKCTADDTFAGMIRFDNGAILQCLFAFGMNTVGPENPGDPDNPFQKDWQISRIYGTEAGIDINRRRVISGPVDHVEVAPLPVDENAEDAMELQARNFIEAIRTDGTPLNSLDDALVLMRMLSGLAESGETGRSVRLD